MPFKYLGIPLDSKKLKTSQWMPLVEMITARIASWTAKKLSYAGRIQLVKSVLFGVQSYWAQLFILPEKIMKLVESHCRSYIWSGTAAVSRKALVAWDRLCLPMSAGGFGLINLKLWNKAAITKVCWDVAHKTDKLWIRWIHTYYIKRNTLENMGIPAQASWMVRKILQSRDKLQYTANYARQAGSMIRYCYLAMLGDLPRMQWKNLVCNNKASPKANFIMWLQLLNRLLTKDRLLAWGMTVEDTCVLCMKARETRDHLFCQCEYADNIWKTLMRWLDYPTANTTSWQNQQGEVLQRAKGRTSKAQLMKIIYAEFVYQMWLERNGREFEQRMRDWHQVARCIAYRSCLRMPSRYLEGLTMIK